jgi:hypothetical protein
VLIGLIADTHGFLGEDARAALEGVDVIVHAGDIGAGVLGPLRQLARVVAVRGNNDSSGEAAELPDHAQFRFGETTIAVVHRLADAPPAGWDVLVFGHCHKRHCDSADGRLLVNPGAAGRRGFHTHRSVALLRLGPDGPACEFVELGPRKASLP